MRARIPFITRVGPGEYLDIAITILVLLAEGLLRGFLSLIPEPLVLVLRRYVMALLPAGLWRSRSRTCNPLSELSHARQMAEYLGYCFEEHIVSSDGYILGIHRIPCALAEGGKCGDNVTPSASSYARRPVVLMGHGFLMCSDIWLCSKDNSLALMLVNEGYDVWMMNNRGNKYSFKHNRLTPQQEEFWDFSLDEFASDLNNVVNYILAYTQQRSLAYCGFSQGTAQLFIGLCTFPALNDKIKICCLLAPTGKPHDLARSFATSIVKSTPSFLFLIFGRKGAFLSVKFWCGVIPNPMWTRMLDFCMRFLFSWKITEISQSDKEACYRHLYSPSSVKSIAHWFQILRSSKFQMYDDAPSWASGSGLSRTHFPVAYPLSAIRCPMSYFYGGSDTLFDKEFVRRELPKPVFELMVDSYEHLDCIWASSARNQLFPAVLGVIEKYGAGNADGSNSLAPKKRVSVHQDEIDFALSNGNFETKDKNI